MLERERELEIIDAALARAGDGRGVLVVIEGAAGEGKTTLLHAARERAGNRTGDDVIADDAHRLDAEALSALIEASQAGATVFCAFRPGEPDADEVALDRLRSAPGAAYLRLSPLSPSAVLALIRRSHRDASGAQAAEIHALTAGNPLSVEALAAGDLSRTHLLPLGDRVLRRAQAISEAAPALLLAMAVLGDGERLALAAEVAASGLDLDTAHAVAHRLRRMEILSGEDPFRFTQPLARASLEHAVPERERATVHQRAAAALERAGRGAAAVAGHLAALAPSGSAAVTAALLTAAEEASDTSRAVRWLRRALAEGAEQPSRAELLQRLGTAEAVVRDAEAIGHLREALELTDGASRRVRVALDLAEVLAHAGQWEEALELIAIVEPDLDEETAEAAVGFTAMVAATAAYDPGRIQIFDELRPRLEQLARGPEWSAHAIRALLGALALIRGEPAELALAQANAALEDGVLLSGPGAGGWALPQLLQTFCLLEQLDRVSAICHQADAAAHGPGAGIARLITSGYRGYALVRAGDLVGGEREWRRALALMPETEMAMIDTTFYFLYADVLVQRPSCADIAARVEAMELEPGFLNTWSGGNLMWARGLLRLAGGNRAGAIADLRAVGAQATALGYGPALLPWRSTLAQALPADERAEAIALIDAELALAEASGLARPIGLALRAAGELTPGPAGIELLRRSVATLERTPSRFETARALIALGSALRRSRRVADAREALEAGLALASAGGAVRLAAHARQELGAAAGRRPREVAQDLALTHSELRVARLAAGGASNREIAGQLFVSLKTVETHLSRAYVKFGLAGRGARAQLQSALSAYEPRA